MLILPGIKAISISDKSSYALSDTVSSAKPPVMVSADLYGAGKTENCLNTYRQAGDEWSRPSQGGGLKELATKCSQTLGCTWVPQCRKSLLVVIPCPLLFALIGWCLDKVGDSSPNGDVKEGLTVIAGGHINHNTALGHYRGG